MYGFITHGRRLRQAALILAVLLFGAGRLPAQSFGNGLLQVDGDASTQGGMTDAEDWDMVMAGLGTSVAHVLLTDATGSHDDDIITSGASKDINDFDVWGSVLSGQPPTKNLVNAFAATYVHPTTNHLFFYFGATRFGGDASVAVGFWFLRNPVGGGSLTFPVSPHQDGDILVICSFPSSGATASTVAVRRWTVTGGVGSLVDLTSDSTNARSAVNSSAVVVPWTFTDANGNASPQAGEFLEGGIDLTALDPTATPCFNALMAETRASVSDSAVIFDYTYGKFVVRTADPTVTLNGDADMTVECHSTFTDPGATGSDSCEGVKVPTVTGSVDPNTIGDYKLTYTVTDLAGRSASVSRIVHVVDTLDPVPDLANLPDVVGGGTVSIPAPPTATDACAGPLIGTTNDPTSYSVIGTYTVTWSYDDGNGHVVTQQQRVIVKDVTPPTITLSPIVIKPFPNDHKYRTILVSDLVASASDDTDTTVDASKVVIETVSSDEREDAPGTSDGSTLKDIVIAAGCRSVQIRAERDGLKNGRVYVITLKVTDASGNVGRAQVRVRVPISQNGSPAVEDPPVYIVTGGCP